LIEPSVGGQSRFVTADRVREGEGPSLKPTVMGEGEVNLGSPAPDEDPRDSPAREPRIAPYLQMVLGHTEG